MKLKYTVTNPEAIPDDLPPGSYNTRLVEITDDLEIKLEFLGERIDPARPRGSYGLIPLIKHESGEIDSDETNA